MQDPSGDGRPAQLPPRSGRDCLLDPACVRCLWQVGGTAGENNDDSHVTAMAPSSARG
jgi:hypothetical protein